jgi:GntR family transcriptional repressor for pyruvate dehydrogenase complex
VVSVATNGQSSLQTLPRERLIDRATEAIKHHILASQLKRGDRLPSETELARSLGVSRNVVRQAVSSLEMLGIVRVAQGRGIYVADLANTDVFRQLAAWIDTSGLDNEEYLQVRTIFEQGIFELLVTQASEADLGHIEAVARALRDAPSDEEIHRLHDEFHQACLAGTGNRFLLTIGTILYRFFWSVAAIGPRVRQMSPAEMQLSHGRIAELLRQRRREDIPAMVKLHLGIPEG